MHPKTLNTEAITHESNHVRAMRWPESTGLFYTVNDL